MCGKDLNMNNIFEKNDSGQSIEGYLSNNFNGVVFLMKEPHNENTQEFWFKEVCTDDRAKNYFNKYPDNPKISASKFRNRFNEVLKSLTNNSNLKLEECLFINLYPYNGKSSVDKESGYKKIIKEKYRGIEMRKDKEHSNISLPYFDKRIDIILSCKPKYIITVSDIFDILLSERKCECKEGIVYSNKKIKRCFYDGESKITYYEIYHPSRSSKIEIKK